MQVFPGFRGSRTGPGGWGTWGTAENLSALGSRQGCCLSCLHVARGRDSEQSGDRQERGAPLQGSRHPRITVRKGRSGVAARTPGGWQLPGARSAPAPRRRRRLPGALPSGHKEGARPAVRAPFRRKRAGRGEPRARAALLARGAAPRLAAPHLPAQAAGRPPRAAPSRPRLGRLAPLRPRRRLPALPRARSAPPAPPPRAASPWRPRSPAPRRATRCGRRRKRPPEPGRAPSRRVGMPRRREARGARPPPDPRAPGTVTSQALGLGWQAPPRRPLFPDPLLPGEGREEGALGHTAPGQTELSAARPCGVQPARPPGRREVSR